MIVELCLILRITMHEAGHQQSVDCVTIAPCGATKEPPNDLLAKTTIKELPPSSITEIQDSIIDNKILSKKLWIQNPILDHSRITQQNLNKVSVQNNEKSHPVASRSPHSITKLAKTLSYGFDPYFSKGSFEPFETRPKPITLVAFRKHGLAPRKAVKRERLAESPEIAELQSPFNPISNFWSDSSFDS